MLSTLTFKCSKNLLSLALSLFLVGYASYSNSSSKTPIEISPPSSIDNYRVNGMGVNGPLQFAEVTLYQFDPQKSNGLGDVVGSSSTNRRAQIIGLEVIEDLKPYYVLEFKTGADTINLNTGKPPIINTLRRLVTAQDLRNETMLYATPLSTLILELALVKINQTGDISQAMISAKKDTKSVFALDVHTDIDLINTPPVLTEQANTTNEQVKVQQLRAVNEVSAALIFQIQQNAASSESTTNDIITALAHDISDGVIDAKVNDQLSTTYNNKAIDILQQYLMEVTLPNSNGKTIKDISGILIHELPLIDDITLDTQRLSSFFYYANNIALRKDFDNDGILNSDDPDDDNDGVDDSVDVAPFDRNITIDTDNVCTQ